ncbi:MAG TPA: penicillin acylase family protein [Candidatus Binatus sp.]|nr:penicillin acylase family protein [Candidatus Binatus sp.]
MRATKTSKITRTYRIFRGIVAVLLLFAGVTLIVGCWIMHHSLPALDGSVQVPGLKEAVMIDRDHWGRPWIRAKSVDDLVTAQGYVLAQDRLWQMDLLRRAAAGDLAEIFGEVALSFDEENRTLGMRQAAERAAADSPPDIRNLLDSYARGVNQYLDQHRSRLPMEFALLRYQPRPWTPADTYLISLYMYKTLTSTWKEKLNRQWVIQKVGPQRAQQMFASFSPQDHFIVGGFVLRRAEASRIPPGLAPPQAPPFIRQEWDSARAVLAQFEEESSQIIGSNNFVVSGAHTASGKPLLANDTHLQLSVPALWYVIHLTAPGWNVAGFALPGAPLVIIGHNDRIAWGFTNSNADVQDLYEETFDPAHSSQYRANGKWLTASIRSEIIHVRGKRDRAIAVVSTRHGPIVYGDSNSPSAVRYALRWTALEPGGLDFGFPLLGQAQNWHEFLAATQRIAGPAQNTIYADVDGNIGFTIPAHIPIRANGNGALPVPGDTDQFEWTSYIPFEELPRALNPLDGIIATANAYTVGPSYKYFLTDRQAGPYRTGRIYELLAGRTGLLPADCNAIQNDVLSLPNKFLASQLIAAASKTQPKDPRTQELIAALNNWDAHATAGSVETSFVEYTRHALLHNLLAPYLHDEISKKYELWEPLSVYNDVWWRDKVFLENILRQRPANWLPSDFSSYDDLLSASAEQAAANLEKHTGRTDSASWNWGRLHTLDMAHPLGRSGALHWLLSIGPYEQGGTLDTIRAMGIGHGPAMRSVSDLSNFDNSLMEIPTGESGQYASPHYRDQFPEWFAGRGIAAPFSESAEEATRAHRLTLLPATNTQNR